MKPVKQRNGERAEAAAVAGELVDEALEREPRSGPGSAK
jgi:hypothetical protein